MVDLCEAPRNDAAVETSLMFTVAEVAVLLNCSAKSIYRINDRGGMPHPVRLGGMLRWHRTTIEQWIAEGCPPRHR